MLRLSTPPLDRRTAGTDTTSEHDALGIGGTCEQQAAEADTAGLLKDEQMTHDTNPTTLRVTVRR